MLELMLALAMEPIQIVELTAIGVSVFFFALGSIFDLRTREVDDRVWLAYGPIGLALTAGRLLMDPSALVLTGISIALTTLFSFALFYFGLFGGADAKAIICLGVTLPLPPTVFPTVLGYAHPFFPVVALIVGFLCSALLGVWFGFRNLVRYVAERGHMFEGLEKESSWKKVSALFLGYRADLSKLRDTFYLYPMEEIVKDDSGSRRALKLYSSAETDREPLVSEFSESFNRLGFTGKVWVTPGLPMLVFILIGLLIALVFGDVLFSWIPILLAH
jgi:preflagellin peptidase FlaK